MTSFDGTDVMVGDVWQEGGGEPVEITVGNSDADGNVFDMFNDEVTSGDGEDTLVGDVWREGGTNSGDFAIDIQVSNSEGSDGNTFDMFNDTLNGGDGADLLVGDLYYTGTDTENDLHISLTDDDGGNAWTMFSDTLNGGAGNDELWGDFLITGSGELQLDLSGLALGDDTLFDDVLSGGAGDDDYWGQLGDDILIGDLGADTFHFGTTLSEDSNLDGVDEDIVIFDGDDTIRDFDFPGEGDTVDLDALFDALGTGDADDRAGEVKITDDATGSVLTIEDDEAFFSITFDGLNLNLGGTEDFGEFTAAELAALGIDVGT